MIKRDFNDIVIVLFLFNVALTVINMEDTIVVYPVRKCTEKSSVDYATVSSSCTTALV